MSTVLLLDKKGILGTLVEISKYTTLSQNDFEDLILESVKNEKKVPTGEIIAVVNGKEGGYCVKKRKGKFEVEFKEKELKIIPKKSQSNDDKMDMEKKQSLLLEFLKEEKRLPNKNEVYKFCPVGAYFQTCEKWGDKAKEIETQIKKCVESTE